MLAMPIVIVPPTRDVKTSASESFHRTLWAYLLGVALLSLFGGLIWLGVATAAPKFEDVDAQRAKQRYKIYGDVVVSDQKALSGPASWLNKEKGVVRLPLEQAVRLALEDLKRSQPHPAYPVAPSNPAPNPAPPTGSNVPGVQGATTTSANNPVLTKQSDSAGSNAPNSNPSPGPSPANDNTQPR